MRFKFTNSSLDGIINVLEQYLKIYEIDISTANIYLNFKKGDFKKELYIYDELEGIFEIVAQYDNVNSETQITKNPKIVVLTKSEYKSICLKIIDEEKERKEKQRMIQDKIRNTGLLVVGLKQNGTYQFYFLNHSPSEKRMKGYMTSLTKKGIYIYKFLKVQNLGTLSDLLSNNFSSKKGKTANGSYFLDKTDVKLLDNILNENAILLSENEGQADKNS